MERLFFFREPNETQFNAFQLREIRRLAKILVRRAVPLPIYKYNKDELIMLCRAYYKFLESCPRLRELEIIDPRHKDSEFEVVDVENDGLKLTIPRFKNNVSQNHINDTDLGEEVAKAESDRGSESSDSDFD